MLVLELPIRKGIQMGKLVAELGTKKVLSLVEGETTVSAYLLTESEEFLAVLKSADSLEQVLDWVEENY
jgi:hypothetical protein